MKPLRLWWWRWRYPNELNFGDEVTAPLLERLTGRPVKWTPLAEADVVGAGSVLQSALRARSANMPEIWGTGMITPFSDPVPENFRPLAVRGRLSLGQLPEQCQAGTMLGDPGILADRLVDGPVSKKYAVGIIPHYIDASSPVMKQLDALSPRVRRISIQWTPEEVAREIASCEVILSSSMHGLIFSDALGVPNLRLKVSDKLVGGDFKFRDYHSAFGDDRYQAPLVPEDVKNLDVDQLVELIQHRFRPATGIEELKNGLLKALPGGDGPRITQDTKREKVAVGNEEKRKGDAGRQEWDQFGPEYDQPRYEDLPRTYVIASMPRSGSHMLGHLMHATGQLGSPLEYIHHRHLKSWQKRLDEPTPASALREVMRRRTSPSGWFGVKAHWPQLANILDDDELLKLLDLQGWIRITRADHVAQAVSLVIAQQTKAWISFHDVRGEPEYDFAAIDKAVKGIEKQEASWDAYFSQNSIEPFTVVYEEMLKDPARTIEAVCQHLGVPAPVEPPEAATTRQATPLNAEWRDRYLAEVSKNPS